jgi:hypothetical protein
LRTRSRAESLTFMSWLWIALGWFSVVVILLGRIDQLVRRVNAVDLKLRLVMAHFALEQSMPTWQRLALDPRSKLRAIKAYQDETGASLADAKAVVEKWLVGN